ncbi:hypothetical protein [Deinococcus wulumuqiensis]|uniref:HEAT repeat domain-containing protein n=1 Tax=Deinococcus wulumuqiensis TaxID=980427 RepID=A0AAV4K8R3_9DEIO|nr:hypothetical protein [Deinococcus wulumuqiensis]QII19990.1 hypothetical protein G6R31_03880 [Deinococcus wulumuqiensis R12]GGI67890.1 hypothetical protein GCM10008021_30150 [Deinococcus wulumuqiensis]GGI94122.1 hypothetical protein GCM10010914_30930 [Deinococcus wulumuqiensis]
MENQQTSKFGRPLSELSQVDWANLEHAYGSAEDVPAQLEAIAAGDEEAYADAFGNLWHQWTTYSATPHAIPFLIGILETGQSELDILSLLSVIGSGHGDAQEAVLAALLKGLPVYLPYLHSQQPEILTSAARLCRDLILETKDAAALEAMQDALLAQPDPDLQAALLYFLGCAAPLISEVEAFARAQLEREDAPLLSLSAALALAHHLGKDAPSEVTEVILSALADEETEERGEALFLDPDNIFDEIAKAGKALGQAQAFAVAFRKQAEVTGDEHLLDYLDELEDWE